MARAMNYQQLLERRDEAKAAYEAAVARKKGQHSLWRAWRRAVADVLRHELRAKRHREAMEREARKPAPARVTLPGQADLFEGIAA